MEDRLIVKKKDIVQFLLLWFSFIFHESLLVRKYSSVMMVFAFFSIVYTMLSYRKTRDKKMCVFLLALLLNVVFIRIINSGGIGFTIWLTWAIDIMTIYCAYKIDENSFFDRYIVLVTIYSIISTICSIVFWIEPNFWKTISITYDFNNFDFHNKYYGFLPIHIVSTQLDKLKRNCGIFTEPGLYQIPLNTALYFLLILKNKISLKKKKYYISLFFIVIALITSKTTSGYLGMLAIIIVYVISKNMKTKLKTISILGLVGIIIVIDYIANGTESLIYITILRKFFVEGKLDFSLGTGTYRLATIPYTIQIMKENFFRSWV